MGDKKSWFTQMDDLDFIYHQFFFTANSLVCQPTASQFIQQLVLRSLVLVAEVIDCVLSEYATEKTTTIMCGERRMVLIRCHSAEHTGQKGEHAYLQNSVDQQDDGHSLLR